MTRIQDRLSVLRRDAALVHLVVLFFGTAFVVTLTIAGNPSRYALLWTGGLVLTLIAPALAHALLPAAVLIWWFSNVPVGSGYSLPAAWCLLGLFTGVALLTAVPDGVPLSRAVVVRYAQRALIVAAMTAGVWALGALLVQARGTSLLATVAGFAALALALIVLPRLVLSREPGKPAG